MNKKRSMSTERTEALKRASLKEPRTISILRARAFTEIYQNFPDKPLTMKRALAFKKYFETVPIRIYENELIVGAITEKRRGAFLIPETNIDGMATGGQFNQVQKKSIGKIIDSASSVISPINPSISGKLALANLLLEAKLDNFENRSTLNFSITPEEKNELNSVILPYWKEKNAYNKYRKYISFKEKSLMEHAIAYAAEHQLVGGVFLFHPNLERVAQTGLGDIIQSAQNRLDSIKGKSKNEADQRDFYEAVIITCKAVITFAHRYADLAESMASIEISMDRKKELLEISKVCRTVPEKKASNFREGLQALWFAFIAVANDDGGHEIPFGRWDQVLYPLYKADLDTGKVTKAEALELLEAYLIKADEVEFLLMNKAQYFEDGNSARITLTIGGVDISGNDATNEISYLFLEALSNTRLPKPNPAVRLHSKTPETFLSRVVEIMADGANTIQVFNDESIIKGFEEKGFSPHDARDYIITGCVQPIPKSTYGSVCAGHLSLPKILEMFLKKNKEEASFQRFLKQYLAFHSDIIKNITKTLESVDRIHDELIPNIFISAIGDGPMDQGKDIKKGSSKNNMTGIGLQGFGTTVDSLMAIKAAVFEDKRYSFKELNRMLRNNFKGFEAQRLYLLNKIDKFGNDVDKVDSLGKILIDALNDEFEKYTTYRGGKYAVGVHSENGAVVFGLTVGATPDGRRMTEPLSLGGGNGRGREKNGLTAALKSFAKYDPKKVIGGVSISINLLPSMFESKEKIYRFRDMLSTYFFEFGGMHLMTTVVDVETLKKAKVVPDDYKDLLVRVSGYSARFIELTERTQDEIISRTAMA